VFVDAQRIAPAQLAQPLPLDGGTHLVEARSKRGASSQRGWSTEISLAPRADAQTLSVPRLIEAEVTEPKPPLTASSAALAPRSVARLAVQRRPATHEPGLGAMQWAGMATLGGAVVSFGLSGVFTAIALDAKQDASAGCNGDYCTAKARERRLDAVRAGDMATGALLAGGVLGTLGVVLLFSESGQPGERGDYALSPWVTTSAAGAVVHGGL
jgi:hypothetical protein